MAVQEDNAEQSDPRHGYAMGGHVVAVPRLKPGLHVVATPIGNLADITIRALETLAGADLIACEDTRHSRKLLTHYAIKVPLLAYHEHNAARRRPELLARLAAGDAIALISDAGTPLVSDPGLKLVQDAIAQDHPVHALPGPSALLAALVCAGLPTDRFLFAGFLPPKRAAREARIAELSAIPATLIFYEAPNRVAATFADLASGLGSERRAVLCRELTKKFETVLRGSLGELSEKLAAGPVKGECVILIAPPDPQQVDLEDPEVTDRLRSAVAEIGVKAAAEALSRETGLPRRDLYQKALALKAGDSG